MEGRFCRQIACGKKGGRVLVHHNQMLKHYSGAIGLKTGFTKATGRCLVSAAERNGLTLIAVTLNAPDDWRDHSVLLGYGFDNYRLELFADVGGFTYPLSVVGGRQSTVTLTNTERIAFVVSKDHSPASYRVESTSHFEYAPVYKGTFTAMLTVYCEGRCIASDLVSAHSVERQK